MILPWWVTALALAAAAAGGWHAHTIWDKAEERDQLAATIVSIQTDTNEARAISQGVQDTLASLKVTNTTIRNEVQREIVEKPVYRDGNCALPDSGRLRLDAAIHAANRAGGSDATLPGPAVPGGQPAR